MSKLGIKISNLLFVQVSHFSLLVGMAAPIWMTAARSEEGIQNPASAFAGVAILGIADSAASIMGRKLGRHRILGTRKTLEGTAGGIVCNTLFWGVLSGFTSCGRSLGHYALASGLSCLLEASTTQLDNIFLPLHHMTLLLLL